MSAPPEAGTRGTGAAADHERQPGGDVTAGSPNDIQQQATGTWASAPLEVAELVHLVGTTYETVLFNRSLHVTLRKLCRRIANFVSCDRTSIFLLDGGRFRGSANFGNPPELDEQFAASEIPQDAAVVDALARAQQPITITDRATSALAPSPPAVAADVKWLTIAPVCDRQASLIGLLTAEHRDGGSSLQVHSEIIGAAAHLVALAVILDRGAAESFDRRPGPATAPSAAWIRSALSDREWEVLELIARGHTNEEAARQLDVSVRTIESHRAALMSKLDVSTRAGLIRAAEAAGIVVFSASRTERR